MREVIGDITEIPFGIIVHQVNCKKAIGGGLSGVLIKKWPAVKAAYFSAFIGHTPEEVYGTWNEVKVNDDITVINLFSQFDYGNAYRTKKQYTNVDYLVNGLKAIRSKYPNLPIYIPKYIGCGLGGADWNEVKKELAHMPLIAIELPDKN